MSTGFKGTYNPDIYKKHLKDTKKEATMSIGTKPEKCDRCGSVKLHKKGFHRNYAGTYQIYQCGECPRCMIGEKVQS